MEYNKKLQTADGEKCVVVVEDVSETGEQSRKFTNEFSEERLFTEWRNNNLATLPR